MSLIELFEDRGAFALSDTATKLVAKPDTSPEDKVSRGRNRWRDLVSMMLSTDGNAEAPEGG